MKRFICILIAGTFAALSWGQTAQEIVDRMDAAMDEARSENFAFTMDIKMPIVGTVTSRAYTWGDKTRLEMVEDGNPVTTWIDGPTEWTYYPSKNEIEIAPHEQTSSSTETTGNMEMFEGITDGYNVKIKKETPTAWYIRCKKSKSNQDKDDPKTMDLIVSKDNYMPLSLSTKASMVTVTLRDVDFNVTEEMVTFDPSKYPTATVIDKR
jgi:outer membrane lipoprotein-sorting protein